MPDDLELPAPPPVRVVALDDRGERVATELLETLPGELSTPEQASSRAKPQAGQPPLLILLSASSLATDDTALATLKQFATHRGVMWLGLLGGDQDQVRTVDAAIDEYLPGRVDALIAITDDAASALCLQAWIRLRHDAPSRAFADLRDANDNARRVASIRAMALAPPPPTEATTPAAAGDLAATRIAEAIVGHAEAAQAQVAQAAQAIGSQAPGSAATTIANCQASVRALLAEPQLPDISDDVAELQGGLRAARQALATPSAQASDEPAALSLAGTDAALAAEISRTGLAAKFGRKKRLADLTAARQQALADWQKQAASAATDTTTRTVAQTAVENLTPRLTAAETAAAEQSEQTRKEAADRWLRESRKRALTLSPDLDIDRSQLSSSWGSATPTVRRYLIVDIDPELHERLENPQAASGAGTDAPTGERSDEGADGGTAVSSQAEAAVTLYVAPDAPRPLAAALLLGLPAAALRPRAGTRSP